jgi:hypothetical protein
MSALITMQVPAQLQCATTTQNVFGSFTVQRIVKDEVAFAPTPNPYNSLQKAVNRLQSGESVFFESFDEAKKQLVSAKHG